MILLINKKEVGTGYLAPHGGAVKAGRMEEVTDVVVPVLTTAYPISLSKWISATLRVVLPSGVRTKRIIG